MGKLNVAIIGLCGFMFVFGCGEPRPTYEEASETLAAERERMDRMADEMIADLMDRAIAGSLDEEYAARRQAEFAEQARRTRKALRVVLEMEAEEAGRPLPPGWDAGLESTEESIAAMPESVDRLANEQDAAKWLAAPDEFTDERKHFPNDVVEGDLLGNNIVGLLPPIDSPPGQAWPRISFQNPEFGPQTWTYSKRVDFHGGPALRGMSGAVYVCDGPLMIPEWRARDGNTARAVDVRLLVLIGGHATYESILMTEKRAASGDWEYHGRFLFRNKDGGYGSGSYIMGEIYGCQQVWWPNGQLRIREFWKDGREVGVQAAWYENGQQRYEIDHFDDDLIVAKMWDVAGKRRVLNYCDGGFRLDGKLREDPQRRLFYSLTKGNPPWSFPLR